jgi:hypothetical protein
VTVELVTQLNEMLKCKTVLIAPSCISDDRFQP